MSWFETFLTNIDFIRYRFVRPLFYCVSVLIATLLSPFFGENYNYEFKEPDKELYSGESLKQINSSPYQKIGITKKPSKRRREKIRIY